MAGKIVADTLEHSTAGSIATNFVVEGSAKAFVSYDANDHLEDDSFNISSLTDGTNLGESDVAFTNTMGNSNYITVCACLEASGRVYRIETRSASGYTSQSTNANGTGKDDVQGHITFGDLA